MKTMMNYKTIMLLFMVSLFSLTVAAQNADEAKTVFSVKIDCKSCVKKIENHFGPMRGIKKVKCSIPDQTVELVYSTKRWDVTKLTAEFKKLELEATPLEACNIAPQPSCCGGH